jgi:hypothetical protein
VKKTSRQSQSLTSNVILPDDDDDDSGFTFKKSIEERIKFMATMVVDTGILSFWIFLVWISGECLVKFGANLSDLDTTILKCLQFIFGAPAIIQASAFTLVDLSAALHSSIEAIKKQWKK